jgi:hypothetical protein
VADRRAGTGRGSRRWTQPACGFVDASRRSRGGPDLRPGRIRCRQAAGKGADATGRCRRCGAVIGGWAGAAIWCRQWPCRSGDPAPLKGGQGRRSGAVKRRGRSGDPAPSNGGAVAVIRRRQRSGRSGDPAPSNDGAPPVIRRRQMAGQERRSGAVIGPGNGGDPAPERMSNLAGKNLRTRA